LRAPNPSSRSFRRKVYRAIPSNHAA
jgi:hypothetical protein